jgi:hypothetical protein
MTHSNLSGQAVLGLGTRLLPLAALLAASTAFAQRVDATSMGHGRRSSD